MTEKGAINMFVAPATKIAFSVAQKGAINTFTDSATDTVVSTAQICPMNLFAASAVLISPAMKGVEIIYNKYKSRKREKTNKVLESKMDKHLQDLNNKLKALQEDFRTSEESTKNEIQIIRAELEKNQGNEEVGILYIMVSMLDQKIQESSKKFHALEEEVEKWREKTKGQLQFHRDELEKQGKEEEEIARHLESMLDQKIQELSQKLQTLEKEVKEWQETTKGDVQHLREELEKNQGKKEILRALESMLKQKLEQLSQKFQALEEDVQEWQDTTKREVQLLRAELRNQGKEEEEIARHLESMLGQKIQELSQKVQTLEEEVKKVPETKREVQLLRAELKNQGKEEEERSMALQCGMETLLQKVSQGFQTLGQTLQWRQEFPYIEYQVFQAYLESSQGIAMQREEIIHQQVLELAGGEKINNICTDSRSAFGIGPAQGAVWNRRLRDAQGTEGIDGPPRHALGFSWRGSARLGLPLAETDKDLLACGGHVSYRKDFETKVGGTVPGASHHLHCNQDQGAESLDPSLLSEEGPEAP